MRIGNLNLDGMVFSAPLAGISNRPFRVLARRAGAAITYTEMISSEAIVRNQKRTLSMIEFGPDEQPLGVQLFGANPEVLGEAAGIVAQRFKPDLIDLNFGCPVKKVVNKNGGAAVLKDMNLTEAIIRTAVRGAGEIPVTVKIRSGWDDAHPVYLEAGRIAEAAGAAAITLHARSRAGAFSGKADWGDIKRLKEALSIPVIGNGDVTSPADARRMLDETGCDAVMVGRAALGNPFIFAEINEYLTNGTLSNGPTRAQRLEMAWLHARLMCEMFGEPQGTRKIRKHFSWYCKGFPGASELRQRLVRVESLAELERILLSQPIPLQLH
jgi:nifR3 family TIM-barrel protein